MRRCDRRWIFFWYSRILKKSEKAYPLGLAYLSAVLKQKGHHVVGVDMSFSSYDAVLDVINSEKIDIIGITLMSFNFEQTVLFFQNLKKRVFLSRRGGGPHATIFGEVWWPRIKIVSNYLIIGDGESRF